MAIIITDICNNCMQGAPFDYCCKIECGEHYYCENCDFMAKQTVFICPDMESEDK